MRNAAAEVLSQHASLPPSALNALVALLEHDIKSVREAAAEVLGQQSSLSVSDSALDALVASIKSENWSVRYNVTKALSRQSSLSASALNALIAFIKDEGQSVRRAAVEVLDKHRWTLYRLLPTLNRQEMELIYKEYLLKQRSDQIEPFYIQDGVLCFYNAKGLQVVPFSGKEKEEAFKLVVQQAQRAAGMPLLPSKKTGQFLISRLS